MTRTMTKTPDQYSEKEMQRRLEAALRAAFKTPPKPMKDIPRKRSKAQVAKEPAYKKPSP